jgi:hypothetical protein
MHLMDPGQNGIFSKARLHTRAIFGNRGPIVTRPQATVERTVNALRYATMAGEKTMPERGRRKVRGTEMRWRGMMKPAMGFIFCHTLRASPLRH